MTVSPVATIGDTVVGAYEELRCRVLAGAPVGSPGGLVLLRREGLVTWMTREAAGGAPVEAADAARRGAAPLVSNEIHAAVVQGLVNMALSGFKETSA